MSVAKAFYCTVALGLAGVLPCSADAQGLIPDQISVWINVYIPDDTSNEYIVDHPYGGTTVRDPLGIACYTTDGRGPSKDPSASSRVHASIDLELLPEDPWVEERVRTMSISETIEYGCSNDEVTCQATGSFDEDEIAFSRNGEIISLEFDLAASNPCNIFAEYFGAIDVEVNLRMDLLKREFEYDALIAEFPNYEMYLQYDDNDPNLVFSTEVEQDSSPTSLLGDASLEISGSGNID